MPLEAIDSHMFVPFLPLIVWLTSLTHPLCHLNLLPPPPEYSTEQDECCECYGDDPIQPEPPRVDAFVTADVEVEEGCAEESLVSLAVAIG